MIRPFVTLNKMTCAICPLRLLYAPFDVTLSPMPPSNPGDHGIAWWLKPPHESKIGVLQVRTSSRLHHLTACLGDRTGCFFAGNQRCDREHVIGAGFGSVHFADEDVRHQFVVAGAIADAARL